MEAWHSSSLMFNQPKSYTFLESLMESAFQEEKKDSNGNCGI